jgi:tetratricopeptide (TPR) repeat protein
VLWECLTGTPPFRRSSEFATLYAHLNDPPPDLRSRRPDLPSALENVLSRGLAKSPVDRYGSCGELVAAARLAAKPVRVHGRRLGLAAAIIAAMAVAGFALGFLIDRAVTDPGMTTAVVTATVAPPSYDGHDLDAAAYALMQSGYFAQALPFSENAVRALRGTGPADAYEGYANYNLGRIDVKLGRCAQAVPVLQRARRLQPKSAPTKNLLKKARACALRH